MKKRILAGFMSLLLAGSMLTSNVMTYAAETERIQAVTAAESVEAEPVEDVRKVTPSDAEKIEDSITDESTVKIPDDHGDMMMPEQFQKVNESILEMRLLQAETALQDAENVFPLADVNLYKKENGNWVGLEEDDTISMDDSFRVIYEFNKGEDPIYVNWSDEYGEPEGVVIAKGDAYTLPGLQDIVKTISLQENHRIPVIVKDENQKDCELGIVTISEDGDVEFLVTYEGEGAEFYEVQVGVEFTLNKEELNSEEVLVFEVSLGNKRYDLLIQESVPKTDVRKTASDAVKEDNKIEWSITVENLGVSNSGYLLTDHIHDNHKYVEGSLKVKASPSNAVYQCTTAVSDDKKQLDIEIYNKTPGTTFQFTYETIVDVFGAVKDWTGAKKKVEIQANNTAILTDQEDGKEIGSAAAGKTLEKEMEAWLTKGGGTIKEDGTIDWTITVNNNGYDIQDVVLYDKFDGNIMELVQDSIKIDGQTFDSSKLTVCGDTETEYRWSYMLDAMTGSQKHTITYQTQIKNFDEWKQQNHSELENIAWIGYKYENPYDGTGALEDWKGPEVRKTANIERNAAISKRAVKYDRSTQIITWEVTVNKYKAEMTNAIVTDQVKEGQEYFAIGEVKLIGSPAPEEILDVEKEGLLTIEKNGYGADKAIIRFGNRLSGKTAVFNIYTRISDPKFASVWAGNGVKTCWNDVYLECTGNAMIKAYAYINYAGTVIEKKAENSYSHTDTDHYINYKITFNQNKMVMKNIQIVDDMGEKRLELVEDEDHPITLENAEDSTGSTRVTLGTSSGEENYYSYDQETGILTFHIGDITSTGSDAVKVIRYTAKISENAYKDSNDKKLNDDGTVNEDMTAIENKATLITSDNPAGTTVTSSIKFKNYVITKEHGTMNDDGCVVYTVAFNAGKQPLAKDLQVVDTLGDGLRYVDDSVKMYRGIVQTDGTVQKDENEQPYENYSYTISETEDGSELTVTLPDGGNEAYVLEYQVQLIDPNGGLTNSAKLSGYAENKEFSANAGLKIASFSSGYMKDSVFVRIIKQDEDSKTPLAGAVFAIYEGETKRAEITSNAKGVAALGGKTLTAGTTYTLQEIKAPDGYELDSTRYSFTAQSGIANAYKKTILNKKAQEPSTEESSTEESGSEEETTTGNETTAGTEESSTGPGSEESSTEESSTESSSEESSAEESSSTETSGSGNNGGGGSSSGGNGGGSHTPTMPGSTEAPSQPETSAAETLPETSPVETLETSPETTKEPTIEDIINRGNELAAMPDSPERDRMVSDYCNEVEEFMSKHPDALVGLPEAARTFVLDAVNDRKVGHKRVALAKTGGFAGTAMAYGTGILLLIGGCYLTLEKRKRESDK